MITKKQAAAKPQPTERLVALASFPFGGKSLKKGDPFIAEVRYGRVLRAARRAMFDPAHAQGNMPAAATTVATKERVTAVETLARKEKSRSNKQASDTPTVSTADAGASVAAAASVESSDFVSAPSTYGAYVGSSGSSVGGGGD
jgi:hypothetical protein